MFVRFYFIHSMTSKKIYLDEHVCKSKGIVGMAKWQFMPIFGWLIANGGWIYGQKWLDLWPYEIIGMAMAIEAMPDFMSMLIKVERKWNLHTSREQQVVKLIFQEAADRIQHIKMFLCLQSFTKISKFQILYKLKRMGRTCNYLQCKARFLLWISVEL